MCVHRKQGVPLGAILSLARAAERKRALRVWKNNSLRDSNTAIGPRGTLGHSPMLTIKMSDALKTIEG